MALLKGQKIVSDQWSRVDELDDPLEIDQGGPIRLQQACHMPLTPRSLMTNLRSSVTPWHLLRSFL